MKTTVLLSWLFWGSLSAGCEHDGHEGREWTTEELAELEAKWGTDVSFYI
jgi:agmatinase